MTQVAFYAPMKSPDHPVASGDRTMGRALIAALTAGGMQVDLASDFATRDGRGDPRFQRQKITEARPEIDRATHVGRAAGWQVWVTYHNYYKAPDLIGPAVARALGIPYLQIESTRARKRLAGPWAAFAEEAEAATDAARVVFHLTARDAEALNTHRPVGQDVVHLRPFLPRETLPGQH